MTAVRSSDTEHLAQQGYVIQQPWVNGITFSDDTQNVPELSANVE